MADIFFPNTSCMFGCTMCEQELAEEHAPALVAREAGADERAMVIED